MIRVFRDFVEGELAYQIRPRAVADDSVGLQLHWSIIDELLGARQYLSHKGYAIVRFHGLDLHIHIDRASPEKELPGRRTDAADASQHRLIVSIEHERRNDLSKFSAGCGLHHRLEKVHAPLDETCGWFKGSIFLEPGHQK